MQQFRSSYLILALVFVFALALTACGGGGSSSSGGTTTLTLGLTPSTPPSLNFGQVQPVVATLKDQDGNIQTSGKITWTSSDPNLLSVSATGGQCGDSLNSTNTTCLCAGKWDANIIVCTPATTSGTATLTASDGTRTTNTTVYVHARVARVVVGTTAPSCTAPTPPLNDCTSSAGTLQLQAIGCDANGNPITVGPADGTGFTWATSDTNVVTSSANGLYTSVNPGITGVYATINNVASVPLNFATCAVKSIKAHVTSATDTTFTADKATTKALTADVVDTKNNTITIAGSRLLWTANNNAATVDQSGNVTTSNAGTGTVLVSCTPPGCNKGFAPVFSNAVVANVNGTSAATVYVASRDSTSMYPVDAVAGTVGAAITLPYKPNSLVMAPRGTVAYLGSDTALMQYSVTAATATAIATVTGRVLGTNLDGSLVVVFDNSTNIADVISVSGTTASLLATFTLTGVPASCDTVNRCPQVDFTNNGQSVYIVAGDTFYVENTYTTPKTFPLGATASAVGLSQQGSFAYVGLTTPNVVPFTTCDQSRLNAAAVTPPAAPQAILSNADGTKIYAVTPPAISAITTTSDYVGCPTALTTSLSTTDLGQGPFTATQSFITSNGAKVVMLTSGSKLYVYDTAGGTTAPVTLAGTATPTITTGGVTLDGANAWVGASDSTLHRIDLTTTADAQQITLTIKPDLVAVLPK